MVVNNIICIIFLFCFISKDKDKILVICIVDGSLHRTQINSLYYTARKYINKNTVGNYIEGMLYKRYNNHSPVFTYYSHRKPLADATQSHQALSRPAASTHTQCIQRRVR